MIAALVLGACIMLVVYPFTIYPLLLGLLPEKPVIRAGEGDALPSASLLFCAYNEAAALPDKIANLRMLKALHPDLEILAFNDGSSDGTGTLLAEAADILTVIDGPGRSGKARGMKTLAALAQGDVLIFTDANVQLETEAVARLLSCYADPAVGGVLGSLRYAGEGASASANVGGLYWRLEEALKDRESRTGNVMGADGSIFSIRRELYPDFPDHVLDDLTVSMSVVFAGYRLIKARDVIAWETMVAERRDEMKRKVRIAARSWHTHLYLRPMLRKMSGLDRFKYGSRKLVRWFGGLWLASGAVAAFVLAWSIAPVVAVALALACVVVIGAGLTGRKGPFAALMDILLAYFATLRGITLAMRGRDFTIWAPAKSRQ
jgi:cellulose synthase/poly-beta-1,6-N-acetylglucosamine synthase-like glycosyltransferase